MKPVSISVKDWLIEHTAKDLKMDESLCNKVISWIFLKTKEATETHSSVEVSGFGKFLISPTKIKKRIARCEFNISYFQRKADAETDEEKKALLIKRVAGSQNRMNYLKSRLPEEYELERNS